MVLAVFILVVGALFVAAIWLAEQLEMTPVDFVLDNPTKGFVGIGAELAAVFAFWTRDGHGKSFLASATAP